MIDIHAHILPEMDDGSAGAEETARMLSLLKQQGVTTVVATPHFYATKDRPERFLARRQAALEKIEYDAKTMPRLALGAEVAYFDGMNRCEALRQLQLGNSGLLLVEMPFTSWTERMVEEILSLQRMLGLQPVLAHVERYGSQFRRFQKRLLDGGVLFQCNADAFLGGLPALRWLRMLKNGEVHFLGSDCHNMDTRAPKLDQAANVIVKKLGGDTLEALDHFAKSILTQEENSAENCPGCVCGRQ